MKRTTIGLGLAAAVLLGPAALSAQAGQQHGGQPRQQSCGCTPRHHHPSGHNHQGGHHKPGHGHHGNGHEGHNPKPPAPKPPHKPRHHKPVCAPKPPHKPPHPGHGHHGHKPPHKPPVVHPRPPVVTPPAHHTTKHVTHRTSTVKRVTPTAHLTALPRTGPADVLAIGGTALAFLCIGGGLVLLTRPERRWTKAAKDSR